MQINLDKYFFYWFVLIDRFLFLFIYLYLPLHQTTANKGNWNTFSVVISESDSEDEYFEEDDGRFVFFFCTGRDSCKDSGKHDCRWGICFLLSMSNMFCFMCRHIKKTTENRQKKKVIEVEAKTLTSTLML